MSDGKTDLKKPKPFSDKPENTTAAPSVDVGAFAPRKQDDDVKAYMQKPFVPESVVGSVPASMVTAGPKVLKGRTVTTGRPNDR